MMKLEKSLSEELIMKSFRKNPVLMQNALVATKISKRVDGEISKVSTTDVSFMSDINESYKDNEGNTKDETFVTADDENFRNKRVFNDSDDIINSFKRKAIEGNGLGLIPDNLEHDAPKHYFCGTRNERVLFVRHVGVHYEALLLDDNSVYIERDLIEQKRYKISGKINGLGNTRNYTVIGFWEMNEEVLLEREYLNEENTVEVYDNKTKNGRLDRGDGIQYK